MVISREALAAPEQRQASAERRRQRNLAGLDKATPQALAVAAGLAQGPACGCKPVCAVGSRERPASAAASERPDLRQVEPALLAPAAPARVDRRPELFV